MQRWFQEKNQGSARDSRIIVDIEKLQNIFFSCDYFCARIMLYGKFIFWRVIDISSARSWHVAVSTIRLPVNAM